MISNVLLVVTRPRSEVSRCLNRKLACLIAKLAIGIHFAFTQVTNQIPMDRRLIQTAGIRIGSSERHMHRAADLLIEEDIARETLNAVVETECDLAQVARALIGVEHRMQELLAASGGGLHDLARLEG